MRKLVVSNIVSLDGYHSGPGGDVMALPMDHSFDSYNLERLQAADTLLLGRATYDGFRSFWPRQADDPDPALVAQLAGQDVRLAIIQEISRRNNAIEKVVVSDSLTEAETDPWRDTTRIVRRRDAQQLIAELKRGPGGDVLVFGSHILWNGLLAAGLVDEVHVMVGNVALGGGVPAFETVKPTPLRLLGTRTWEGSDNVLLRYAVSGR